MYLVNRVAGGGWQVIRHPPPATRHSHWLLKERDPKLENKFLVNPLNNLHPHPGADGQKEGENPAIERQ